MTAYIRLMVLFVLWDYTNSQAEENVTYNSTDTTEIQTEIPLPENSCQFASLKCSYRTGCGAMLKSYVFECDALINNRTDTCSEQCKNSLIGLTSTPEGQKLMTCDCDDPQCSWSKSRIEACRASVVLATRPDTVVSCTEARWICSSDAECAKALEYYNILCNALFRGKRCTDRCKNSLSILRRQERAAKLGACRCGPDERFEEFLCSDIKRNMADLCEEEEEVVTTESPVDEDNEVEVDEAPQKNRNGGNRNCCSAVIFLMLAVILKRAL